MNLMEQYHTLSDVGTAGCCVVTSESSNVLCDASRASHLVASGDAQLLHAHVSALESTSHTGVGLRRD